jgi:hypothetical protein
MLRLAFASLAASFAVACVTPDLPPRTQDDAEPDAQPPPPDARLDCEVKHNAVGSGYHNPGTPCLECHNGQQAGAPRFSIGGTVFRDAAGTIPVVGATVIVIDGNGLVVKLPTQQNGNFYSQAILSPPFVTAVSQCPDNVPMLSNFVSGDCNSCHRAVGEPGYVVFRP